MVFEREATMSLEPVDRGYAVSTGMISKGSLFKIDLLIGIVSIPLCARDFARNPQYQSTEPILLTYHAPTSIIVTGCLTQRQWSPIFIMQTLCLSSSNQV